jgi:epoxide hydrolase-like predicted phosphatase
MIKAVIFDCFGVLTTDSWKAFLDTLPEGTDVARAKELNHQRDAGLIEHDDFMQQVFEITGRYPQDIERMTSSEVVKNTALLAYIKELKQDYAIGLISNIASNWIRESFLTAEEQERFDEMILSYEVGMTKPDPRIFMLACERLRVSPEEAVFIDDIPHYVEAARAEKLQAVVYRDFSQMKAELEAILYPE